MQQSVILTDRDEATGLSVWNAKDYVNTKLDNSSLMNTRGLIYADDKLLFRGFPFAPDYVSDELDTVSVDVPSFRVFECVEGTLIRVFNHKGKWFTVTNRRLDAFKSRWSAIKTTFGETFADGIIRISSAFCDEIDLTVEQKKERLTLFYDCCLDPSKKYIFFLRPSAEERIVCDTCLSPSVLFIGTEYAASESEDVAFSIDFDAQIQLHDMIKFPKSKEVFGLQSMSDIVNYMSTLSFRKAVGLILFRNNPTGLEAVKMTLKEYADRARVRNNVPNLRFRYFELRQNDNSADTELFFDMYPHMRETAAVVETQIYETCKYLHQLYLRIYIDHENTGTLAEVVADALNYIHNEYRRTHVRTTASRINDLLFVGSTASQLNRLVKAHLFEKKLIASEEHQ